MRNLDELNKFRLNVADRYGWNGDHTCGAFLINSPLDNGDLRVLAASGGGWDHVSVSRKNRTPTWGEMEYIKRLFFNDDETVMQLHVAVSDHINRHPYTLHLWRPQTEKIPVPPKIMV